MAYFRIEYYSNALRRETSFEVMIPNDPRGDMPAPADDRPAADAHQYLIEAGIHPGTPAAGQHDHICFHVLFRSNERKLSSSSTLYISPA